MRSDQVWCKLSTLSAVASSKVNNFFTDSGVYAESQFYHRARAKKTEGIRWLVAGAVMLGDGDIVVVSGDGDVERSNEW